MDIFLRMCNNPRFSEFGDSLLGNQNPQDRADTITGAFWMRVNYFWGP